MLDVSKGAIQGGLQKTLLAHVNVGTYEPSEPSGAKEVRNLILLGAENIARIGNVQVLCEPDGPAGSSGEPSELYATGRTTPTLWKNMVTVGAGRTPLGWEIRSNITLTAAKGIKYIHSTSPSTSYGNIKSSNILLAKSYEARLLDHGLSHLAGPASTPTCIAGYHTPEVTNIRKISPKADVYSFGVLLLELLTGKALQQALLNEEGVDLPRWVQPIAHDEWTFEVFYLELLRYHNVEEQMLQLLQLAVDCLAQYPDMRPSMSEVVSRFEDIRQSGERVVEQDMQPHQSHGIEEAEDQSSRKTDSSEGSRPPSLDS